MEVTAREYLLLLAIEAEAEDIRDYVPISKLADRFNTLQELKSALNSCTAKKLIILSDMGKLTLGKGSEVALRELGIEHVRARKKKLNLP